MSIAISIDPVKASYVAGEIVTINITGGSAMAAAAVSLYGPTEQDDIFADVLDGSGTFSFVEVAFPDAPSGSGYYLHVLADGSSDDTPAFAIVGTPEEVASFTSGVITQTDVELTWDDLPDEFGYDIERSLDAGTGDPWTQVQEPGEDQTSITDTGLTPGTDYHYRIRGKNAAGAGGWSAVLHITTQSDEPAPIQGTIVMLSDAFGFGFGF